ncbi:regulatory protein RecX [bacterium]|nr:regulatory protein RecX [bacterium]MBT6293350.1 regulatory protein RecX [bacterium]
MEKFDKKMYAQALKYLSIREYSELELYRKLQKKFVCNNSQIIKGILDKLKGSNYLSDERFTSSKVKSLINKKYGPNYIKLKMLNFGVDSKNTNSEIYKNIESIELNLEDLINRKFQDSTFEEKNKLIRKLISKGYDSSMILKKIDEFLAKIESS